MYGGWLSQRCNKSDWRLFYLGAGEGVGLVPAEDEDDTVMKTGTYFDEANE